MKLAPERDQAKMFRLIMNNQDDYYYVHFNRTVWTCAGQQRLARRKDFRGATRQCWVVQSRQTNQVVVSMRGTTTYRLALVWYLRRQERRARQQNDHAKLLQVQKLRGRIARIQVGNLGLCIRHLCGNAECCNPRHLEVGTHGENGRDRWFHEWTRQGGGEPEHLQQLRQLLWQLHPALQELW